MALAIDPSPALVTGKPWSFGTGVPSLPLPSGLQDRSQERAHWKPSLLLLSKLPRKPQTLMSEQFETIREDKVLPGTNVPLRSERRESKGFTTSRDKDIITIVHAEYEVE